MDVQENWMKENSKCLKTNGKQVIDLTISIQKVANIFLHLNKISAAPAPYMFIIQTNCLFVQETINKSYQNLAIGLIKFQKFFPFLVDSTMLVAAN